MSLLRSLSSRAHYSLLSLPLCMLAGELDAQTTLNATDLASLRAHIATANAGSGNYTINLAAGTYTLNGAAGDANPANGDLDITRATAGNIVFAGAGAATTIIDANSVDRVFHINTGANVIVTFQNITIRNGRAVDNGTATSESRGGGIYVESATNVNLSAVRLESNSADGADGTNGTNGSSGSDGGNGFDGAGAFGGGIYVAGGTFTVTNSTLSLNSAQGGIGGNGGDGGASSDFNGLASGGDGGDGGGGGNARGGAIYLAAGTLNISSSTLDGCSATGGAGGNGGNGGDAFVSATTSNSATARGGDGGRGGAGSSASGGGVYVAGGTVNITNSTLNNLDGNGGDGGAGGSGGDASGTGSGFVSSTGGSGGQGGDGSFAVGGGIYVFAGNVNVVNSTVASCSALNGSGGAGGLGGTPGGSTGSDGSNTTSAGGGAYIEPAGIFIVAGSIFAGSTSDFGEDVQGNLTAGASLFQIAPNGTITPGTGANITGQDPLLQALADNGGPTQTRALGVGSPAIDAGSNTLSLTTDQRSGNYVRVFGTSADMGALEVQPPGGAGGGGGGDDEEDESSCTAHGGSSWYSLLGILAALMLSVRRLFAARRT